MAKKKVKKTKKAHKTHKRNKSSKILLYTAWILAIIATFLSITLIWYFFWHMDKPKVEVKKEKLYTKPLKQELPKSVNKQLKELLKKEKQKVVKKEDLPASHELDFKENAKVLKPIPRPIRVSQKKPKLAIIIDDVATQGHVNAINKLHLVLTKSFLPPRAARPHTPELARKEKFYMVHLPLEAQNFHAEEPNTLRVSDSEQKIYKRIDTIQKWFPRVHFINNHTGSKFTSNELAMNRLIYALEKHHIHFIDSRTIASTKAPKVLKNMGLPYVHRDIFLDHHMDVAYVKEQIKKAVAYAKKHKTAIAIGHPHPNTLEALRESKALLKEVDLVYVREVY